MDEKGKKGINIDYRLFTKLIYQGFLDRFLPTVAGAT